MKNVYSRSASLKAGATGFCPGCLHAVAARIIAECVDELDRREDVIGVMPIGCASLQMLNFDFQMVLAAHGRAGAVATGVKRSKPQNLVFAYQGDGDAAAIGMAETIHAANRGENITVIMINNSTYGMTGGQLSPTTLVGQKASTVGPNGRDPEMEGYPIRMCEVLDKLEAPAYIARFALDTPAHINQAKQGIKKAFEKQLLKSGGYCFIELMSNCPTNWGMTPLNTLKFMEERTIPVFPLGVIRNKEE